MHEKKRKMEKLLIYYWSTAMESWVNMLSSFDYTSLFKTKNIFDWLMIIAFMMLYMNCIFIISAGHIHKYSINACLILHIINNYIELSSLSKAQRILVVGVMSLLCSTYDYATYAFAVESYNSFLFWYVLFDMPTRGFWVMCICLTRRRVLITNYSLWFWFE